MSCELKNKEVTMTISIIAAVATNRVIGDNGRIPWRLSDDLKRFKLFTTAKAVVVGRKTWEAMNMPLKGRTVYVLSRQADYKPLHDAIRIESLDEVKETDIMIAGGSEIYRQFIPQADYMYLTHVHASPSGDALFPVVDWDKWMSVGWESYPYDGRNEHESSFETYVKKR